MLTSVEVISPRASIAPLVLSVVNAASSPFQIREIKGLGPVKADINTTPFGSVDGELYTGSTVSKRNIVLTLGLNPTWASQQTVATLRAELYKYFTPKLRVRLELTSDHMVPVGIDGYVESFEENMFSEDPEAQVSIICPEPNFAALTPTVVTGSVETYPGTPTAIDYEGTVPVGFVLTVESATSYQGTIRPQNVVDDVTEYISADLPTTITPIRKYFLSTVQGDKYSRVMTGPIVNNNLLVDVTAAMAWLQLTPGNNDFNVTGVPDATYSLTGLTWSMSYVAQYGGM